MNFLIHVVVGGLNIPIFYLTILANPPSDHSLKCGGVNGTLTTIDFGIQSNDSTINNLIAKQDQYSGGGIQSIKAISEFKFYSSPCCF
jgi:hypothetical protein